MFKKIVKRIIHPRWTLPQEEPFTGLIGNGNLVIGKNVDLRKCSIRIQSFQKGVENINIGDDSVMEGRVLLHSKDAHLRIGDRVFVGSNTLFFCYDSIRVGNDVMFSWDCTIIDTNAHSLNSDERENDVLDWKKGPEFKDWSCIESKEIVIGDKCWIGFKSIIMKGVELGEGCVVAAGSVVTKSFEPFSVIGGNPAVFIKKTR